MRRMLAALLLAFIVLAAVVSAAQITVHHGGAGIGIGEVLGGGGGGGCVVNTSNVNDCEVNG